jgi:hypothetical protein
MKDMRRQGILDGNKEPAAGSGVYAGGPGYLFRGCASAEEVAKEFASNRRPPVVFGDPDNKLSEPPG